MKTPIRTQLTLTTLAVLLIGMGLAAGLSWLAVEQLFLDTQRENLLSQARLSAAALQGQPLPASDQPYAQTANILPGIHTHLLEEQDAVVLALPQDGDYASLRLPSLDDRGGYGDGLYARPEIESALQGVPATAIHRVEGRRVLYAAAPIYTESGEISGIVYIASPLAPSGLPISVLLQLLGAVLAAILLALAAGTLLSRRIARPLEQLAGAARSVAAGNLAEQVPVDREIKELHSLGESFNQMIVSLQKSDETKNVFIANVTHELRTPLTVIKGTIETLEDGALDDTEGRGPLLTAMQRETERLIRLVQELLVLTRADAGALQLDLRSLDLAQLAQTRCDGLSRLAAQRGITLNVDAQKSTAVRGDPDRLVQVLNTEFYLSDLRTYRDQAREMAMKAAREKARDLALAAGSDIGCVLNINENSWSYFNGWGWYGGNSSSRDLWTQNTVQNAAPPTGAEGALSEAGPISVGQISVRAEVSASFGLK